MLTKPWSLRILSTNEYHSWSISLSSHEQFRYSQSRTPPPMVWSISCLFLYDMGIIFLDLWGQYWNLFQNFSWSLWGSTPAEICWCTCLGGWVKKLKRFLIHFSPNKISFSLWLLPPCKISEPYDNAFWEKSNRGGEKERETSPTWDMGRCDG